MSIRRNARTDASLRVLALGLTFFVLPGFVLPVVVLLVIPDKSID